ncbi:MAG: metalloprotease [Flavobacteriaceae bacterium]|nr:metalloprotease [Flavobacteriaceae bacterium]
MKKYLLSIALSFSATLSMWAQHDISITAELRTGDNILIISEEIVYRNTSEVTLTEIYLNDWANSFSSKNTPLAKRFAENFKSGFHFEKDHKRGRTTIQNISGQNGETIPWERGEELDIIKLNLTSPLAAGATIKISLNYSVKLPETKFTRFGVSKNKEYKLKYWYITPAVFDGTWHTYSNKNTDDFYQWPNNYQIQLKTPIDYKAFTDLNITSEEITEGSKVFRLVGKDRLNADIYLQNLASFESVVTDKLEVITNLKDKKVSPAGKAILIDRIVGYLDENLGDYPFDKIVVSEADYRNSPVYGLNQLPDFISPFPYGFELDMELLKTTTRKYLTNTLPIDPRKDHWLLGAMQIYLMIEYVNTYYPDMKIMGELSDFPVIKWSHASELEFNDQYSFLYLNMARRNLHQSLDTPRDSLVKFNKNIASDYQAGNGFKYLSDYLGDKVVDNSLKEYYKQHKLKPTSPSKFEAILKSRTNLPVDWFFDNYVSKRNTIDFKIKKVKKLEDSLQVTVINKRDDPMPVSIYGLNKDSIVFKKWLPPISEQTTITVPKESIRKLALNYEGVIPEIDQRNNYKKVKGLLNRPLQFRVFKDVEDPEYNQVFFMPVFQYNLYDGFSFGPKVYNKTFLPKGLHYRLEPQYGSRSNTVIGKGSVVYTQRLDEENLYSVRFGLAGSYFSYNEGLFYRRLSPYVTFAYRDNSDLRKNEKHFINFRNVNVFRDEDPSDPTQDPNYSVLNMQYVYSDNNLINFSRGVFDYQLSNDFSKLSAQYEYRKLFLNNRQLNLRFFAGIFVFNKTRDKGDFFSFAIDRPTDYLFDYNYYGRSEDTGLFSQQFILAEGGFKSQLEPAFANEWIATVNASTNIWKWIYAYGDIGLAKNKGVEAKAIWDTGIRASLVADYFELYFPLYSNLGWEPGLENYDERIRFIVTLDIKTLLGLFTREWY